MIEAAMDEAIAWHIALADAGADEWRRFVLWLEQDAAHQDAYDRLSLDDAALAPALIEVSAATAAPVSPVSAHRRWVRWGGAGGGLLAAAAAAWIAFLPASPPQSDPYAIETAPGMRHTVIMADGTRIDMNGGSKILLDRDEPRVATLERGEASFNVVHHADRPFEVRSGGVVLRDVGTVFNVARTSRELTVGVAEGSVIYQPKAEAVSLTRGMQLSSRTGEDRITLRRIDIESVGAWARGHVDFRDAALEAVVDDLARATGARIAVAPELAQRTFTGSLRTDRNAEQVAERLAALVGASARRDGRGWTIAPKSVGAT